MGRVRRALCSLTSGPRRPVAGARDLLTILDEGRLRTGALVLADNVKFPGAPECRDDMRAEEGKRWRTTKHASHVEYQLLLTDLVLVSEHLDEA